MRNIDSSRWYIPLVASTEVVRRSGDLTTLDPGNTIGTLPTAPVIPQDDSLLWLDSALVSSVSASSGLVSRVRDRSPSGNHATQDNAALRPEYLSSPVYGFDFRD